MSRLGLQGTDAPLLAICVVAYYVNPGTNSASYSANASVNWNWPIVNRYNMWNPATPNRLLIPVSGFYKVGATLRMGSGHSDWNDWGMMLNSDTFVEAAAVLQATHGSGASASTCGATVLKLNAGDFLTVSLPRAYTLYSDSSRFFAYEIRGVSATFGSNYVKP